ncbi:MAG: hypothetical protein J6Z22_04740 [Lachnospiraceae bacterium]|nr:hypothetical protein [Lachnospiraceae bacterium]
MGYMEGKCGHCGETVKEKSNMWAYGSPIRFCPRCKQEYLDRRWREVAIEGFDPKSTSPAYYVKAFFLCLACLAVSGGWTYYTVHYRNEYHTAMVALIIVSAIGAIGCLILSLGIALGFMKKGNEQYLQESERRMRDPEYVKKLQAYGYRIPEKYMPAVSDTEPEQESSN